MRSDSQQTTCMVVSIVLHVALLLIFIISVEFSSPLDVIENTNKHDVISAVVLGDTEKSRILPKPTPPPVVPEVKPLPPKPLPKPKEPEPVAVKKEVVAIKPIKKIKLKAIDPSDLLADIEKQTKKQKKVQEKQLKTQFEKMVREQAEKSLRQQLMDEDIKLKGTETRQAQGVVNKYKALILQAISERWIVPIQVNKKLYCELMIRVAPGGMVLDVQITRSSGDPALDSSARAAVLKSSPLPVPKDSAGFESFRQFVLKMKPENILTHDGGLSAG